MKKRLNFLLLIPLLVSFTGCKVSSEKEEKVTLLFAGYGAARDAFKKVIPLFQKEWLEQTGQSVQIKQSYASSGTQSRAIVAGFQADVAALAVEVDIERLVREGLITHEWKRNFGGMVTHSAVVFAVREGNPQQIKQWGDLVSKDIELLMPNPKTSGGAQWNILSAYGAAIKGKVSGYPPSKEGGRDFLVDLLQKVTVMDKGARESILNFEFGAGDVALTYESEALTGIAHGQRYEVVIPQTSIVVENPVAVVDVVAKKHGVLEVAEAFVEFLFTKEAQQIFAQSGFRSVNPQVLNETIKGYPFISDYWKVDTLGGWDKITENFFGPKGIYALALEEVRQSQKR